MNQQQQQQQQQQQKHRLRMLNLCHWGLKLILLPNALPRFCYCQTRKKC